MNTDKMKYGAVPSNSNVAAAKDIELGSRIPQVVEDEMKGADSTGAIVARRNSSVNLKRGQSATGIVSTNKQSGTNVIPSAVTVQAPRRLSKAELQKKLEQQPAVMKYTEHQFDFAQLSNFFKTDIDMSDVRNSKGLSTSKVEYLIQEFGANTLTPPPRTPHWLLFLKQFNNYFMLLLIAAGILSIVAWATAPSNPTNLYLGLLLLVVVVVTCYETYSQEAKSDQLMEKFRSMVPENCIVIRDGVAATIKSEGLVVGDLIRLKNGDKIPADCRVIFNEGLRVDQSMITGESEPVETTVNMCDPNPLEARNIVFNGSLVVDGGCLAIVIRTGDDTLIGSMVELTGDVGKVESTLKTDVEYFVVLLTKFSFLQAVIIFIVGCIRGIDPLTAFIQGFIIIMVANVPQGLPSTITAALYIIADRMGKQNVFVKKLDIIETLGSCNLICTDKTGTLTKNLMSVANVWAVGHTYSSEHMTQNAVKFKGTHGTESVLVGETSALEKLIAVATLNSRVILERKDADSELAPSGDATELGLYRFSSSLTETLFGSAIENFRKANTKVHEIPFNSSNKWQMSIHQVAGLRKPQDILLLKGAPEVILNKCASFVDADGITKPIDEDFKNTYIKSYEMFGGQGERVLGFAMKQMQVSFADEMSRDGQYKDKLKEKLVGKGEFPVRDLVFVGLITLMDPPRDEVPQAVKDCHTAGVKVVMVTGDHPITATAIARKIGLITGPTRDEIAKMKNILPSEVSEQEAQAIVIHGSQIPDMSTDAWTNLLSKKEIVFARTSPEQKLIIVQKFTEAGNLVAMTGDGTNDSPALKQAAIGVAMGKNGSDVAREAADIVLLDDNFASIVVGIREGRLLFANLQKSIAYTLTHLVPEVIPVLLWAFVGFPQTMGGIQILCIDLLTELCPASSLAYENPESDIMLVPPRDPKKDKLCTTPMLCYAYFQQGFIETGICYFAFYMVMDFYGITFHELALTNNNYFTIPNKGPYHSDSGRIYSNAEQRHILAIAQASFYLGIVICQAVHIFLCRTSSVPLWEHGIFNNWYTNGAVIIALGLGLIVTYCPGVQDVVLTEDPPSKIMLYTALLAFGSLTLWAEGRKYFVRSFPHHWITKFLKW